MKPIVIIGDGNASSLSALLKNVFEEAGIQVQFQEGSTVFSGLDKAFEEAAETLEDLPQELVQHLEKVTPRKGVGEETLLQSILGSPFASKPLHGLGGKGLGLPREESLHVLLTRKGVGYPYTVASNTLFRSQEAAADAAATLPDFKLEQEYFAAEIPPLMIRNLKSLLPKGKSSH